MPWPYLANIITELPDANRDAQEIAYWTTFAALLS
jgi:hypothetical protein